MNSASDAPGLEIRLFGGFDVLVGGSSMPPLRSRREQWLLALLVLRHAQDTSRDWLASTLWPDNTEEQALFYLRKSLSNLRKALGSEAGRLASPTPRTVRLDLTGASVDVVAFDRASRPDEAVRLYRGALLPDCHEEWANLERSQRERAYASALEQLAKEADPASTVRWLRLLIAADPYRESAYRALMEALAACGDGAAVTVVYRDLHARLSQDLNSDPSPESEALYKELSRASKPVVSFPSRPAEVRETGRHLPVPLSDLIGREAEIAEVLGWMKQRRLVSLVGAGGIGKTRLSIAVAERALSQFEDGVWFVDLAVLSDPSLVPNATSTALGIAEEHPRSLTESLVALLRNRSMLLVLDNCEHVVGACADLVFQLLSACPDLSILATSRQALNVSGEQVYRVPSLGVPDPREENVEAYEAVKLFADRAVRADTNFRMTKRNSADVVEICRQLDGIPLAIEMAAARLRSMSVGEVRSRLDDRFRLLKGANRGDLPRHHTLRATIDWSYDQLSEPERGLLRRVSVFAGGWTLEAAEGVVSGDDVQDLLSSLVDKSLAIAEIHGENTRYRLLETVKQYAYYRLLESDEALAARIRHRDYYLAFAMEIRPKLITSEQAHWFSVLDAEHDNLRQALNLCLEEPDGGVPGLKLIGALMRFWMIRGYYSEGRNWFDQISQLPSGKGRTRDRGQALNGIGLLAWRQCDYQGAQAIFRESLSISRELGDMVDVGRVLNNLALVTRDVGDYAGARGMHEEGIQILLDCGERLTAAICLSNLGVVNQCQGDFASARLAFEEGLAVQRELGEKSATSVCLSSLGEVALDQGDIEYARRCHEEGLEIARELKDEYGCASHLYGLGRAATMRGEIEEARSLLRESLAKMSTLGERTLITDYFSTFASLARQEAHHERAVRLLGAAKALRDTTGSPAPAYALERMEQSLTELRDILGEDEFLRFHQGGSAMSMEQAIEYALSS